MVVDFSSVTDRELRGIGPKLLSYKALPAPARFHRSLAKNRWIFGGNRSGKSESCIGYDLCAFALGIHPRRPTPVYPDLPENAIIWAAADDWNLVGKLLWQEKIRDYLPASQIKQLIWHNKQESVPKEIRLVNGNVIEFRAYEQRRNAFQGRQIDAFYGDEQCKNDSENIFTEIQARLLDREGFTAQSMTPTQPQTWLEERIEDLPASDEIFYANLNDNRKSRGGYIADTEIDLMIGQWAPEVQQTRIEGHFAAFLGAVYKSFNRSHHMCQPFEIPQEWPRYRSIDWGFNNPLACLWLARSPDRVWYVYAEHYRAQQTLAFHAQQIHKISGKERYRVTWADHDAQDRHEFKQLGIATMPAKKDVHLGIEAVQAALKVGGNGKSRLQIFSTCKRTLKEMAAYKWAEGTEIKDAKDEPLQLNDHTCDCVRYGIYGVEHKGYFGELA
jgi:phage terminase large subunit